MPRNSARAPAGFTLATFVCVRYRFDADRERIEGRLDDSDPRVRSTALHIVAQTITDGRMAWTPVLIEKIEAIETTAEG